MSKTKIDNQQVSQSETAHDSISAKHPSEPPVLHSELMAYVFASCPGLYQYPWWEVTDALTSLINATTELCANMAVPFVEINAFWLGHLIVLQTLNQRWTDRGSQPAEVEMEMGRHQSELQLLSAAQQAFKEAYYWRGSAAPQAKYAEAKLAARRALMENQHEMFDGFPRLVEILRKLCSRQVAAYTAEEVKLENDQFLDAIHMLARDQANPADVTNPPARIRAALARQQRRERERDQERWMPPTEDQISSLEDLENVESTAIAKVDWERGSQALEIPEDQKVAVEARIEGLDLQGSDAAESLGWDADRLERTRRSLEPDRRWGRDLRKQFAAYDQNKNPEKYTKSLKQKEN